MLALNSGEDHTARLQLRKFCRYAGRVLIALSCRQCRQLDASGALARPNFPNISPSIGRIIMDQVPADVTAESAGNESPAKRFVGYVIERIAKDNGFAARLKRGG